MLRSRQEQITSYISTSLRISVAHLDSLNSTRAAIEDAMHRAGIEADVWCEGADVHIDLDDANQLPLAAATAYQALTTGRF